MVELGVLTAIINVVLLLFILLADRAVSHIVLGLATSRLHQRLAAPVIHDIDTWLPNIPLTLIRLRRYPSKSPKYIARSTGFQRLELTYL